MADTPDSLADELNRELDSNNQDNALAIVKPSLRAIGERVRSLGDSSPAIPQGDPSGTTIDTTTYDNPITGSGKLTTVVLASDTAIEAVAVDGDDFPRALLADPTDGWYFGDGTVDPYLEQAEFNTFTHTNYGKQLLAFPAVTVGGMTIFSQGGAPNIGGNVGDFYIRKNGDPTANTYLYACTTAGAAGDAVWTALVTS